MRYAFADFVLDLRAGVLTRRGTRVPARPMVVDLIALLIAGRDRVVGQREVVQTLWSDVHVGPSSLSTLVGEARRALNDSGRDQEFIATRAGRGLRFVAPVRPLAGVECGGAADEASGDRPLAALLEPTRFLGRGALIGRAHRSLDRLAMGPVPPHLITGELGIGRSRALEAIADLAERSGASVHRARFDDPAPPERTGLRELLGSLEHALRRAPGAEARRCALELAQLGRPEGRGRPVALGWDAVAARALLALARSRPVALVLDDVCAADLDSLRRIRHLLRATRRASVLWVIALRTPPPLATSAIREELSRWLAEPECWVHRLEPLGESDLAELLALHGRPSGAGWVARLWARSGGIPLLAHDCLATGFGVTPPAADPTHRSPPPSRALLDRLRPHIRGLPERDRRLLTAAAALGRSFSPRLLERVLEEPPHATRGRLADLTAAGWLSPAHASDARAHFRHRALYTGLCWCGSARTRARMHRRIARALEAQPDECDPSEERHARLARHWSACIPLAGAEPALRHALLAASEARRRRDHAAASALLELALDALSALPAPPVELRIRVRFALAHSEALCGRRAAAQRQARLAAALVRGLHDRSTNR